MSVLLQWQTSAGKFFIAVSSDLYGCRLRCCCVVPPLWKAYVDVGGGGQDTHNLGLLRPLDARKRPTEKE